LAPPRDTVTARPAWLQLADAYALAAAALALAAAGRWIALWRERRRTRALVTRRVDWVALAPSPTRTATAAASTADWVHGWQARLLHWVPGNQSWSGVIEHKTLALPGLPPACEGLNILHLSDFHLNGKIGRDYFAQFLQAARLLPADLLVLTGDIVDRAPCLEWLPDLLDNWHVPYGKWFILGNHDRRIRDESRLRGAMASLGFIDAADGRWHTIHIDRTGLAPVARESLSTPPDASNPMAPHAANSPPGAALRPGALPHPDTTAAEIILAGDERPWYGKLVPPPANIPPGDNRLRILLAHSPDRVFWAQGRFDLVLAGHTHGGQVRFPIIGPVISPSRHGVRFACGSGVFQFGDTVMHVTRGISADDPLRLNCPPEITFLHITAHPPTPRLQPARASPSTLHPNLTTHPPKLAEKNCRRDER
jgi:hypothetical protein